VAIDPVDMTPCRLPGSRQRNIEPNAFPEHEPFRLSIICDESKPMTNCVPWRFDPNQLTVEINISRLRFTCPEKRFYELRSAGANESGKAYNLPFPNSEADIGEFSFSCQSLDAQHLLAIFSRHFFGKLFADFTANHVPHKVVGRDLLNRSGHNMPAIAQDSHAISDLVNLFQPMQNVD